MRTVFKMVALAGALALTGVACSSSDSGGALTPPPSTSPSASSDASPSPSPSESSPTAPAGAVEASKVTGTATNLFEPKDIIVTVGEEVEWEWEDAIGGHNVVADDGSFRSGDAVETGDFKHTFETVGTFAYHCQIHGAPGGVGMAGTVTVVAS